MRTPDKGPLHLAAVAALADAVKLLVTAMDQPEWSPHRVILAVDIVGFNDESHDDEVQLALRRALYLILTQAFEAAPIAWADTVHEDRGDGAVIVLPPDVPAATVLGPLALHLRAAVRRHNRLASEIAQISLRVSVHAGEVHRDDYGLAGRAVNHVFRLLDAPAFKAVACGATALIVSGTLHDDVVRHAPGLIDPATYRPVIAALKETRAPAWVQVCEDADIVSLPANSA
ncbi:hypothetical protein J4573_20750 [Actinomadura barringtoniae]|uniref:Guanylate cyclase domain-containing protein n=1 Tax=Actinomadura barringtoniae TaxID=1427535 RepID=A0A939T4K9_9ACTN|nr:hypothetical protein [Actinomadura barringtoniae]MBO2449543.1 hypothetical protein [Actinomadura barringtoniae]